MQPHLGNSTWMHLIIGSVSPEYNFDRKAKRQCKSLKKYICLNRHSDSGEGVKIMIAAVQKKLVQWTCPLKKNILLMQWT